MSLAAARALGLDEVWWLVSPGNPLKPKAGMAPYAARFASAQRQARRSIIRVSDIERRLGIVYTVDTLRALDLRFPRHRFIWLMGADTVAQFHHWKDWRRLAATVPIAVLSRPGYEGRARTARVSGWFRRFVRPGAQACEWTRWSAPAIVFLRLTPDRTSATQLRAADPLWHERFARNTDAGSSVIDSANHRRNLVRHP